MTNYEYIFYLIFQSAADATTNLYLYICCTYAHTHTLNSNEIQIKFKIFGYETSFLVHFYCLTNFDNHLIYRFRMVVVAAAAAATAVVGVHLGMQHTNRTPLTYFLDMRHTLISIISIFFSSFFILFYFIFGYEYQYHPKCKSISCQHLFFTH